MPVSLDLSKAWKSQRHGDLVAVLTWVNDSRALVLLPALRRDAALYKAYLLSAATGEFQLTGNNIELLLSRRLLADAGAFTLTGNNAALTKTGGGGSSAADIWNYVLSNGMTAEEALVAVYTALHKEGGVLTVGKFLGLK